MFLQVVAAVIRGHQNTILISKRKNNSHQGGLWEFPGGKVEQGETPLDALKREIDEELGITVSEARPLIKVHHHYSDKSVCLDVWEVTVYDGDSFEDVDGVLKGREGQTVEWVSLDEMNARPFPEANHPILKAVALPSHYTITPDFTCSEPSIDELNKFILSLRTCIESGSTLIQFRAPTLNKNNYLNVAKEALKHCHELGAKLILNGEVALLDQLEADGIHLSSRQMMTFSTGSISVRPIAPNLWLGASCH
ncbi:MAG: Nudix family hydrolase, partial [Pseudomonadales bacterium]|nr:Nudix family hydrolase [Pseudomonadales bacterium]